jgi:hypothetical protein
MQEKETNETQISKEVSKKEMFRNMLKAQKPSTTLLVIAGIIVAMVIFQAGVFVGFHKASFGRDWGNHYYDNFGPRNGFMGVTHMGHQFPNAHGAAGLIIKTDVATVIVQDRDLTEKIILIQPTTKILKQDQEISATDLKADDFIVVIGDPNDQGQIEAKFIRVLPAPFQIPAQTPVAPQIPVQNPVTQN